MFFKRTKKARKYEIDTDLKELEAKIENLKQEINYLLGPIFSAITLMCFIFYKIDVYKKYK